MSKVQAAQRLESSHSDEVAEQESVGTAFARRLRMAIGDQPVFRFAQECGMSDSLVRKYLEGSLPGLEKLIMIAGAAGVRVGWLATGELPMRDSVRTGASPCVRSLHPAAFGDFELVPRYEIQPDANDEADVDQGEGIELLAFHRDWLMRESLQPDGLVLVGARGDSMEPTVADGDLLLVDTRERGVTEDAIYVIQLDDHVVAKRLQVDWKGGLWVRSDNPQYVEQHITDQEAAQLRVVGRVVWVVRRV
ncbi:hypothetical protein B1C78_14575 [Thioalkalivibrio denitrificans]|uniref:Peptidase S24/S26A/S26B/S26C domain-containing protein n=2 Tax=Thioalkalivibrio denitrificans TaxID=108003 RepID=A0A1V3NCJ2_9GAMM|nr:hypothetical protein B1C78_14575 [Thioalkalivibrio denitrificans]